VVEVQLHIPALGNEGSGRSTSFHVDALVYKERHGILFFKLARLRSGGDKPIAVQERKPERWPKASSPDATPGRSRRSVHAMALRPEW